MKYRLVLRSLEQLSGTRVEQIRIIGGGSKNRLLNQWTADATGRKVLAGPAEATVLGNLGIQILATGGASLAPRGSRYRGSFIPNRGLRAARN